MTRTDQERLVLALLQEAEPPSAVAAQFGISVSYARKVKRGEVLVHLLPHLPRVRRSVNSCRDCIHFRDRPDDQRDVLYCRMGFPEGISLRAGATCPAFFPDA